MFPLEKSRQSGIERVIGVEARREEEILAEIGEIFSQKETEINELPKTPEQKQIINFLGEVLPQFASKYGARPLVIGESQIVLKKATLFQSILNEVKAFWGRQATVAYYAPDKQGIYYIEESQRNFVDSAFYYFSFARSLAHEILHFLSFQSLQVFGKRDGQKSQGIEDGLPRGEILEIRRLGLAVNVSERGKRNKYYFSEINEGVIELLVDKFFSELPFEKMPETLRKSLKEQEQRRLRYLKSLSPKERELVENFGSGIIFERRRSSPAGLNVAIFRPDQRILVLNLIRDIYEKNKFLFSSEEEIFNIFVEATMTGRLLPLARLIEKTYGKGSFRKIGKETAEIFQ